MKKSYPAADGWLTARLRIETDASLDEDDVKSFLTAGKPDQYEFAKYKAFKTVIVVVFRKIKQA